MMASEASAPAAMDKPAGASAAAAGKAKVVAVTAAEDTAAGKRHFAKGEMSEAAERYELALQKLVREHGDLGAPCGDAYLQYGEALLELAKLEASMFQEKTAANPGPSDGGASGADAGGAGPAQPAEDGDAAPSTLELAYEVLECARVIFLREGMEGRVADAHHLIGEYLLEANEFDHAAAEFVNSLELREKVYPPHSRMIAESHVFIGITKQHHEKYDEAVTAYQTAIKTLRLAIDDLKAQGSDSAKKEIKSLSEAITDLQLKADDAAVDRDHKKLAEAAKQTTAGAEVAAAGSAGAGAAAAEGQTTIGFGKKKKAGSAAGAAAAPTDLTSLVRKKKRKPAADAATEPTKRAKTD